MRKGALIKLLRSIIEGKRLGECWKNAGYSSIEDAVEDINSLIGTVGKERERGSSQGRGEYEDFVVIYVDGGSRGNPGPSAAAAVAYFQDGGKAGTRKLSLGKKTNNEAEYYAVIEGLKLAKTIGARKVLLKLDSELVYRQLRNMYRVKNDRLRVLFKEVQRLKDWFDEVLFEHVGREKNREADRLVNSVLDGTVESDCS